MTKLIQNSWSSAKTNAKALAAGITGSLTVIVTYLLNGVFNLDVPNEVIIEFMAVLTFVVVWLVPNAQPQE